MAGDINIGNIFGDLFGLAGEYIEDKDKRNEFNMQIAKSRDQFNIAVLTMKTHPKVDALVKLLYAINSLWRPLGGAVMTGFAIYASIKGIELDSTVNTVLIGAFPAWGASRHISKMKGKEKKWYNPFD